MNRNKTVFFRKYKTTVVLMIFAVAIKIITFFPHWIEYTYRPFFYKPVSIFYRMLFGWLPFSAGDILYAFAGSWILLQLYRAAKALIKRKVTWAVVFSKAQKLVNLFLCIYIYFNIAWGLNYNRLGIAHQLHLDPQPYTEADLKMITRQLLPEVNRYRNFFPDTTISINDYRKVYDTAVATYREAEKRLPFLQYNSPSIKKSYYGRLGNYLGFLGYYNPFTGEAQVNLTIPRFTIPYVACHEIGHQLGYASESEASFAGYLVASKSSNVLFRYSAIFDMFLYANRELGRKDSAAARTNFRQLDTLVRRDFRLVREFQIRTRTPIEPFIEMFYDFYLKANQQEKGVESYNQVVGWLIAYQKKTGHI